MRLLISLLEAKPIKKKTKETKKETSSSSSESESEKETTKKKTKSKVEKYSIIIIGCHHNYSLFPKRSQAVRVAVVVRRRKKK